MSLLNKDLYVLIDDSDSMLPWLAEPSEVDALIQEVKERDLFNSVSKLTIDISDPQTAKGLIGDLFEQPENNVIFFITDFVADEWETSAPRKFLNILGENNHVVILNTFSQSMQRGTCMSLPNYLLIEPEEFRALNNSMIKVKNHIEDMSFWDKHHKVLHNRFKDTNRRVFPHYVLNDFKWKSYNRKYKHADLRKWVNTFRGKKTNDDVRHLGLIIIPFEDEEDYEEAVGHKYLKLKRKVEIKHKLFYIKHPNLKDDPDKGLSPEERNLSEAEKNIIKTVDRIYATLSPTSRVLAYLLYEQNEDLVFDINKIKKELEDYINKPSFSIYKANTSHLVEIFLSGFVKKNPEYSTDKNKPRFLLRRDIKDLFMKDHVWSKSLIREVHDSKYGRKEEEVDPLDWVD